jgi:hypothetical protein
MKKLLPATKVSKLSKKQLEGALSPSTRSRAKRAETSNLPVLMTGASPPAQMCCIARGELEGVPFLKPTEKVRINMKNLRTVTGKNKDKKLP